MDTEYCDSCGRVCDGVHSINNNKDEKHIQNIVKILLSQKENILDEILKRVIEHINLKKICNNYFVNFLFCNNYITK